MWTYSGDHGFLVKCDCDLISLHMLMFFFLLSRYVTDKGGGYDMTVMISTCQNANVRSFFFFLFFITPLFLRYNFTAFFFFLFPR